MTNSEQKDIDILETQWAEYRQDLVAKLESAKVAVKEFRACIKALDLLIEKETSK